MSKIHGQFKIAGLSPTGMDIAGVWMRDHATVGFLFDDSIQSVTISGKMVPYGDFHSRLSKGNLKVALTLDKRSLQTVTIPEMGDFSLNFKADTTPPTSPPVNQKLEIELKGVGFTNFLAWLGRLFEKQPWLPKGFREWLQPFRRQHKNRQLLIRQIRINGELMIDFDQPHSVFESDFILRHSRIGVNVIGWFHGFLGVGESARACAKAARNAGFEVDPVMLKLKLNGGQSKDLWVDSIVDTGHRGITIAHVDAPQSFDLTRQHPVEMDADNYRIGYWAWELPEFPDSWIQFASQFDEIWCPSEFCRSAIGPKLPVPVIVMPHAIQIPEVDRNPDIWRKRFALPEDVFLFLFSFDLNSYTPRKNPESVIEAYRQAFTKKRPPTEKQVGLVLKMHGKGYDEVVRVQLEKLKKEIPGLYIIDETLSRQELAGLQVACDCYVSLHRSEGFGLGVAEMMAHGKPVISTDWSATTEFVDAETGCPVRSNLVTLDRNIGPYTKGQAWADPDVMHAAEWMQRVVADPELVKKIGVNAKNRIEKDFSLHSIGKRYLSRLKSIALFRKPLL
jgi:glycosyltransferase involved in cell wall biosynthesis